MTEWLARYEEDGEVFFRIGRDRDEVVAEWLGVARLVARVDGSAHRLEPAPGADPRGLAKIERGGVQLLLRHLAGKLALHGASVAFGGRAVVLLGRAAQGKSTLAAALCANGAALLADDAVALDEEGREFVVTALEELHWLDEGARRAIPALASAVVEGDAVSSNGKVPVAASRTTTRGELAAFVELAFVEHPPRLRRVSPLEAMAALVPQSVRFVLDEPAAHLRELEALSRLVEVVPTFRLERPRALELLSASCDLVSDLVRRAPGAEGHR